MSVNCTYLNGIGPKWVYRTLGTAIDYRIRYYFAVTPNERLAAWMGASYLAFKPWEGDNDIPVDWDEIQGATAFMFDITPGIAQGPYVWKVLELFFYRLDATLAASPPVGSRLEPEAERLLGRYCFVLALLEEASRVGDLTYLENSPLLLPTPKQSVSDLLALPQDAWIDDLSAMSALFYDRCQHLLSRPAILNPHFAGGNDVGGADADLIVDGCLLELKASIHPKIEPDWLWQLAGYLLLDYHDEHHINSAGIYMVRQGTQFTWPVEKFLLLLTGEQRASLMALRQEFQARFSKPVRRTR